MLKGAKPKRGRRYVSTRMSDDLINRINIYLLDKPEYQPRKGARSGAAQFVRDSIEEKLAEKDFRVLNRLRYTEQAMAYGLDQLEKFMVEVEKEISEFKGDEYYRERDQYIEQLEDLKKRLTLIHEAFAVKC